MGSWGHGSCVMDRIPLDVKCAIQFLWLWMGFKEGAYWSGGWREACEAKLLRRFRRFFHGFFHEKRTCCGKAISDVRHASSYYLLMFLFILFILGVSCFKSWRILRRCTLGLPVTHPQASSTMTTLQHQLTHMNAYLNKHLVSYSFFSNWGHWEM